MNPNDWLETISSQIPAIDLLQKIGYTYLTPAEALAHRQGKRTKIVLEGILTAQLHKFNSINTRGQIHTFSDANIQKAIAAISQFPYDALYTTSTEREFWAVWKEENPTSFDVELHALINISHAQTEKLLAWRAPAEQEQIKQLWAAGERQVSDQDRILYSLLLPDRLLELIYGYIIFDNGTKKIARYQQYFAVKATLDRVKQMRGDSSRQGGMIWHTTGSGKSLTMVMLAKALALEKKTILNPKIILVNDRIDLDKQLKDTFKNCGAQVTQAKSGQDLHPTSRSLRHRALSQI
jgi:hypothetical protein